MAVPTGHVRHVFAAHILELQDDVLERLVQRRADVHIPIGKGRAVVENESLAGLRVAFAQFFVNALLVPARQPLRLTLHQAGFHRKTSLRQIERVLVIHSDGAGS